MRRIEIVTSAFNEEDCLAEFFTRLQNVFDGETNFGFRIIVFDNGSVDRTWEIIQNASTKYSNLSGFRMSRNFSLDAALTAGLDLASADAVIIMASDLQDPPETIPLLLREFEAGFDQVLVRITKRDSVPWLRRKLSTFFYKGAYVMTEGMLPENVSDFRLMSRNVYSAVKSLREQHRFMRGISAWVGFPTTTIDIERPPRFGGESSWLKTSLTKVISHALKSIFAFSSRPLIWVSTLGFILSGLSISATSILALTWVFGSVPFAGYGTIVGLIFLGFSLTIFSIGVVGQYLALVYDEVKKRPIYIVSERTQS
jgi:dolichol-phosphate mannosyltransferase